MGTSSATRSAYRSLCRVRSGARDSMPGMMDTILNLGLNDQTVLSLAAATKNERFAWDCYRRFIQMYGDVVLGVQKKEGEDHEPFETVIEGYKHEKYHTNLEDSKLTAEDQRELVKRFKALVLERTGRGFPNDPWEQLRGAAGAVFGSWMNDRAIVYRRKYNIPTEWGTAVNVQAMVYGNTGDLSGSGVAFTRNPANGTNEFYGEFLINAQGEDVVAGVRTPEPVLKLKDQMPEVLRRAPEGPLDPREALQGRAGHRIHDPGRQALHAADPQRKAHRHGGAQVLDRYGEGEADRLEDRHPAQPGRPARAAPGARLRPGRGQEGESNRHRPARRPRRRHREDLPQRRPRGRRGGKGRKGPPRAHRDLARGPARHDRRRGHPHGARRCLLARRPRRPPDGQGLRLRRVRPSCRLRQEDRERRRPDLQRGRLPLDRRHDRRGLRRPDQDGPVRDRRRASSTATRPHAPRRSSRTTAS